MHGNLVFACLNSSIRKTSTKSNYGNCSFFFGVTCWLDWKMEQTKMFYLTGSRKALKIVVVGCTCRSHWKSNKLIWIILLLGPCRETTSWFLSLCLGINVEKPCVHQEQTNEHTDTIQWLLASVSKNRSLVMPLIKPVPGIYWDWRKWCSTLSRFTKSKQVRCGSVYELISLIETWSIAFSELGCLLITFLSRRHVLCPPSTCL